MLLKLCLFETTEPKIQRKSQYNMSYTIQYDSVSGSQSANKGSGSSIIAYFSVRQPLMRRVCLDSHACVTVTGWCLHPNSKVFQGLQATLHITHDLRSGICNRLPKVISAGSRLYFRG